MNIDLDWLKSNAQPLLIGAVMTAYFLYRALKFRAIRKQIPTLIANGAQIVDVRSAGEFEAGHHPDAVNIPLQALASQSGKLSKDRTIVLCCASGTRSGMAVGILKTAGFTRVLNAGPWQNTLHQALVATR